MFEKVFGFDRTLDRTSLQVLILRHEASDAALAELQRGFSRAGVRAEVVPLAAALGRLGPGVVVYLLPEHATPEVIERLSRARVLTITGEPGLVEAGQAAVSLEQEGSRTQVVLNPERLVAEGHSFEAQLMKVARVVRTGAGTAAPQAAGFTPPALLVFEKPPYPERARRLGVEGDVVLRLQVDAQGRVTGVEVVTGVSRTGGIDDAAVAAARSARFRPAVQDGRAVPSTFLLTLPFRL
jgi:TonB family protein